MKDNKGLVNFDYIPDGQSEIHIRLLNWRRWVRVHPHGWQTHPMWRKAITSRQWDLEPHINIPCNTLDAMLIEKTISKLPEKHREAIRWNYINGSDPLKESRLLGVSRCGLLELVCTARTMVENAAKNKGKHLEKNSADMYNGAKLAMA